MCWAAVLQRAPPLRPPHAANTKQEGRVLGQSGEQSRGRGGGVARRGVAASPAACMARLSQSTLAESWAGRAARRLYASATLGAIRHYWSPPSQPTSSACSGETTPALERANGVAASTAATPKATPTATPTPRDSAQRAARRRHLEALFYTRPAWGGGAEWRRGGAQSGGLAGPLRPTPRWLGRSGRAMAEQRPILPN